MYSEIIFRNIQDLGGITIGGTNINIIRYADDIDLLATSESKLQELIDQVVFHGKNYGMEINTKKTEYMVITKPQSIPMCKIKIDGITLNEVEKFKYLGFRITSDARCHKDVRARIAMAKQSFNTLENILRNKNQSVSVRTRVLKCYVWPVLLYGCESWTLTTALIKNLESAEMWFYRKMQRISHIAKKTNKQVLIQTNQDKSLFRTIKK